ncbi:MAG: NAD(P)H-binding protein [Nitriliruptoraceae bacterium]
MPVLVTSSQRPQARLVVARLLDHGGEVRAYASGDVGSLRAQGAMVATGEADDEGRLEAALTDVHTVVHLGEGLLTANPARSIDEVATLVTAATNAQVARIIALSIAGASLQADDPLRRAYGRIEAMLEQCPVPTIVVRTSVVGHPDVIDTLVTAGLDADALSTPVAPVAIEDLVELLAALDDARSQATSGNLVLAADGPSIMSLGDYLAGLGALAIVDGRVVADLVGRTLADTAIVSTLNEAIKGPWTNDDPTVIDAWSLMGLVPVAPEGGAAAGES